MLGIPDVITYANFGDDRLRGLGVVGSNLPFSIDFDRRPYNTVWLGAIITDTDAPRILIAGDFNCDINSRFYVEFCKFVCTEGKQNGSEQTIAALYNTLIEKAL